MDRGTRDELLGALADEIGSVRVGHPTRVGIDGPPAAGKTTLADELADAMRARGRDVVRATIEDFLLPRSVRFRRGEDSAEGCYHDSFDFDALHRALLDPLGPGGAGRFRSGVYDRDADTARSEPEKTATADTVLLFDGVFLLRPELIDRWDLRIFVSVPLDETLGRARIRDRTPTRSAAEVERRYRSRYLPSQQYYFDTSRPAVRADVVVHNEDVRRPAWEVRTRPPGSYGSVRPPSG